MSWKNSSFGRLHTYPSESFLFRILSHNFFFLTFFMALLFEFCSITLHYIYIYIFFLFFCVCSASTSEHWVNKQSLKNCCNIKAVRCWLYFLCIVFVVVVAFHIPNKTTYHATIHILWIIEEIVPKATLL